MNKERAKRSEAPNIDMSGLRYLSLSSLRQKVKSRCTITVHVGASDYLAFS